MFTFISNIPEFMFFPPIPSFIFVHYLLNTVVLQDRYFTIFWKENRKLSIYTRARIRSCDIIRRSFWKRTVVPSVFIFRLHIVYFMFIDKHQPMWYTYGTTKDSDPADRLQTSYTVRTCSTSDTACVAPVDRRQFTG